jgi:hypothetical protein
VAFRENFLKICHFGLFFKKIFKNPTATPPSRHPYWIVTIMWAKSAENSTIHHSFFTPDHHIRAFALENSDFSPQIAMPKSEARRCRGKNGRETVHPCIEGLGGLKRGLPNVAFGSPQAARASRHFWKKGKKVSSFKIVTDRHQDTESSCQFSSSS